MRSYLPSIILFAGLILLILFMMPSPMFKLFRQEVQQELARHPPAPQGVFTEMDIKPLPEPVQRYFRTCGWLGKPKMSNATIAINQMKLKMDLNKDFVSVKSYQFNSVAAPVRLAYLKSAMYGFIPFSGRDRYQDGIGHMYIKLLRYFPVVDLKGIEMDRAALVTVLAETFLAPSYALQPYISWTPIDANTASASLTDGNIKVSGTFYFDDASEFVRFETMDRYMTQKDGSMKQTKWVATVSDYVGRNGVRVPSRMSAAWQTENGLKEYAQRNIEDVRYDVETIDEVLFKNH